MTGRIMRTTGKVLFCAVVAMCGFGVGGSNSMKIVGICGNGGVEALESGSVSPPPMGGAWIALEDDPAAVGGDTSASALQSLSPSPDQRGAGR